MLPSPPGPDLSSKFTLIIDGLCRLVTAHTWRDMARAPMFMLLHRQLRRRAERFAALVTLLEAGIAPRTAAPRWRAAPPARSEVGGAPPVRVPRNRGWLLRLTKHEGAMYAAQLYWLVSDPKVAALLTASPQARRLIRPIWLIVTTDPLPECLKPQPRPATPAPQPEPAAAGMPSYDAVTATVPPAPSQAAPDHVEPAPVPDPSAVGAAETLPPAPPADPPAGTLPPATPAQVPANEGEPEHAPGPEPEHAVAPQPVSTLAAATSERVAEPSPHQPGSVRAELRPLATRDAVAGVSAWPSSP